jgi:hypothetical protein
MNSMTESETDLGTWLQTAFRGNLPEEVQQALKHRDTMENTFVEMMTEWRPEMKEAMQHLHQLHKADTEMTYVVIKNLFLRHLEGHS